MIESRNLIKDYSSKARALNGVNISVQKGEIFGFIGPNGAGKTTFMKTLLDFTKPTSGEVLILGEKPSWKSRKYMGYLPERISIHTFLTAEEFLNYQARLSGLPSGEIQSEIAICLEKVKLTEAGKKRIGSFSKGMLQRLGFAQAIISKPEILLLDEPNSGLDPIGIQDLRGIILEEKKRGATVFLNSHQLLEVEKICDRVAILNRGEVVAQGSRSELTGLRGIEIELENSNEKIDQFLKELDSEMIQKDGRYSLNTENLDSEKERTIPARIVELGGKINLYSRRQESLEEIFQRVIKDQKV
ncbi:MAG: ABC transporter ATP-binding protein [Spirochaetia bacterium]|nr:ABC transporter ATP-binding protein [Spirochaetia bacterium]